MTDVHAIILTLDEEKHIARCISSIRAVCKTILIVDSGSTDRTCEIATALGAVVTENPWLNHSTQFNFGIAASEGKTGWLLRIDADEYLSAESAAELPSFLERQAADVDGIFVQRQIVFMGKRIKWGGIEPNWQLRLWRAGRGRCEQRWMDERIVVRGRTVRSQIRLTDENLNSLDWWIAKHNRYASREVIELLASRSQLDADAQMHTRGARTPIKLKFLVKEFIYNRLPAGWRSAAYFLYRYVLRLGFLDGKPGYYFHVLQGFWYRTLVDAKLTEVTSLAAARGISLDQAVRLATGIDAQIAAPAQGPAPAAIDDCLPMRSASQSGA